ncbi:hypothetical protein ACKC9G_09490 [Pokkaliibacter sp. CJK22405]|uniref:hypothetical protein n=1 Tax=Pokkaliibacter sp. CJK22405 TaxID=3384615 RepID=UPI0039847D2D
MPDLALLDLNLLKTLDALLAEYHQSIARMRAPLPAEAVSVNLRPTKPDPLCE